MIKRIGQSVEKIVMKVIFMIAFASAGSVIACFFESIELLLVLVVTFGATGYVVGHKETERLAQK